jgi:hypothetical protein
MGRLLAAGQRAEVFEWGSRVVKLCRSKGSKRVTFREAAIHAAVECLGLPVPTVWSLHDGEPVARRSDVLRMRVSLYFTLIRNRSMMCA